MVLANGEVLQLGGKLLKDNAGYNLMHLMMGSEGTLGIVTEVTMRLYPEDKHTATVVASFNTIDDASNAILAMMQKGVAPLAAEYQDRRLNVESARLLGLRWPVNLGTSDLLLILSEINEKNLHESLRTIDAVCDTNHVCEAVVALTKQEQDDMLAIRSGSYEVIKHEIYHSFDMAVPPGKMPQFLHQLWKLMDHYGTSTNITAHIADGNIHNDILQVDGGPPSYYEALKEAMYALCFQFGGTITGEHGIGKLRMEDLKLQKSPVEMALMQGIKKLFDPKGLLNPDTVVKTCEG